MSAEEPVRIVIGKMKKAISLFLMRGQALSIAFAIIVGMCSASARAEWSIYIPRIMDFDLSLGLDDCRKSLGLMACATEVIQVYGDSDPWPGHKVYSIFGLSIFGAPNNPPLPCSSGDTSARCRQPDKNNSCPATKLPIVLSNGKKYLDEEIYTASSDSVLPAVNVRYDYIPGSGSASSYRKNWSLNLGDVSISLGKDDSAFDFSYARDVYDLAGLEALPPQQPYSLYPVTGQRNGAYPVYPLNIKLGSKQYYIQIEHDGSQANDDTKTNFKISRTATSSLNYGVDDGWQLQKADGGKFNVNARGAITGYTDAKGRSFIVVWNKSSFGRFNVDIADMTGRSMSLSWQSSDIAIFTDVDGNQTRLGFNDNGTNGPTFTVAFADQTPFDWSDNPTKVFTHNTSPAKIYGSVKSVVENGQLVATYQYDVTTGMPIYESLANGAESTSINYVLDSNNFVASATTTNALGKVSTLNFSNHAHAQQPDSVVGQPSTSCAASDSHYTYDTNGYRLTETNNAGFVTETVHDTRGNIIQERRGLTWSAGVGSSLVEGNDIQKITTVWNTDFTKPTQRTHRAKINGTWQDTKREDWVYDTHARETSYTITDLTNYTVPYATNGRTRTTTTAYTFFDAAQTIVATKTVNGPLTPATQADGVDDITVYTYNNKSQLTQVQDADGHITQYADYLNRGVPQTVTDANGLVTHMTYTARGWLDTVTQQTSQGDAITNFDYYPNGKLQKTTLPDGSYLSYEYNAASQLTAVSNNLGERIEYTPSPLDGKWTKQTAKNGMGQIVRTQQRVEDELGRIKKLLLADGSTDIENFYDGDDKLSSRNNRVGKKATTARVVSTQYGYDALARITATIDPVGEITTIDQDGSNDTSKVTDARSNATTYLHDGFGDVIQQVSPDTGTTRYWYNALGQVKQKIDARNITKTSTFDALGRKTADQYPADTTLNVTYQYDQTTVQGEASEGIGRLAAALRTNANAYYTYDDRGNLSTDIHSISGILYRTRYSYNAASQLQSITYPSGRIVSYQRDSLGRVAQINVQDSATATAVPVVSNITYQAFGPISGFTYGNAIVDTRSYDLNGRLTDIIEKYSTTTIQNLGYAYDWAGNIELLTDRRSSTRTQTLGYDDVNRLLAASGAYGAQTFTYDEVGNRLSGTTVSGSTTTTYTTTPVTTSNRLATVQRQVGTATPTSKAIVYDAAGNATTDFSRTLTYDAAGRLKSAKNGSVTLLALYNAQGQRISKWQSSAPTAAVHFHYDQRGQLIGETSATGVTQRDYIWLDNIPVAILTGALGSTVRNYIHSNYLNSPEVITDATRAPIWRGDYAPYGSVTVGGAFVNNLRFPGQYLDTETGLSYNYFRDYDLVTGRYVESDPIGLDGGINTYVYVEGNPINKVDPDGLMGRGGQPDRGSTAGKQPMTCEQKCNYQRNFCTAVVGTTSTAATIISQGNLAAGGAISAGGTAAAIACANADDACRADCKNKDQCEDSQ